VRPPLQVAFLILISFALKHQSQRRVQLATSSQHHRLVDVAAGRVPLLFLRGKSNRSLLSFATSCDSSVAPCQCVRRRRRHLRQRCGRVRSQHSPVARRVLRGVQQPPRHRHLQRHPQQPDAHNHNLCAEAAVSRVGLHRSGIQPRFVTCGGRYSAGVACMDALVGLSPLCTACWVDNMACDAATCKEKCLLAKLTRAPPVDKHGNLNALLPRLCSFFG
jgi:hypothetical protein